MDNKWVVLTTGLLIIALLPMPYGYYQILRIIICFISGMISYRLYDKKIIGWLFWGYIAIAIIYNPIARISFSKDIWIFLNIGTIIYYLGTYKIINKKITKIL